MEAQGCLFDGATLKPARLEKNDRLGAAFLLSYFASGTVGKKAMKQALSDRIVLVVEDDWLVREDMTGWFRQQRWRVFEAAIGAEALQMLREMQRIHLLFTDISLADAVTGWEIAEAARVSYPFLAVIYASGGPDDPARRVEGGIFLPKPVTPNDLMAATSQLIPLR